MATTTDVPSGQPAAEQQTQTPGLKVFVGNLPFSVDNEGLRALAAEAGGEITDAQIIRHGPRSKGFGFVDYATTAQADNAVKVLHGKTVDGRELAVEIAKQKEPRPPKERKPRQQQPRIDDATTEGEVAEGQAQAAVGDRKKKAKKPRRRGAAAAAAGDAQPGEQAAAVDAEKPNPSAVDGEGEGAGQAKKQKKPRQPRQPHPLGEPSKTQLFVDNLPFRIKTAEDQPKKDFGDEQLKALFVEKGFEPVSVRVVTRPFGFARGRSRGLGFVDLKNEAEQQKAIDALHGTEVEGRKINVKVARERLEPENKDAAGDENQDAADAAVAAPAAEKRPSSPEAQVIAS